MAELNRRETRPWNLGIEIDNKRNYFKTQRGGIIQKPGK